MEDEGDFEELFSFAAASPQPAEKASPSTSSEFDMIVNNSDDSAAGDNARATSDDAMVPSTPGSNSDFDDLFGTPPPRESAAAKSFGAEATKQDEDPEASFLGSNALDEFQVHDEGTRDFLDWLDDDAGKKDSSKGAGNEANNNDKDGDLNDSDDDFDFDKMLSEVGIDDTKPTTTAAATTSTTAAATTSKVKEESAPTPSNEKTAPQKEVAVVKQIPTSQQQQLSQNEPEEVKPAEEKPTSVVPTAPTKQQVDSISKEPEMKVIEDNALPEESVTKPTNEHAANDFVMESTGDVDQANTAADVMDDVSTHDEATIKENENQSNETNTVNEQQLVRPSVEDELSYQQWNDDVEEDNADITDVNDIPEGNKTGGEKLAEEKKPVFSSLSEAIRSNLSTIEDVKLLFGHEIGVDGVRTISSEDRAYLWTKVVCGKVLGDVDNSSLAESFREWQNNCSTGANGEMPMLDELITKATSIDSSNEERDQTKEQLLSLLNFHTQGKGPAAKTDTLLPPVAYAILKTGMPLAVVSVLLSQIEPNAMPLMRLSIQERFLAAKALHADFYLLACYHLPLLMMHLDRNCQGWYWPKKQESKSAADGTPSEVVDTDDNNEECLKEDAKSKKIENNGLIPESWFVTNFAGECDGACLDHSNLLPLWDHILVTGDSSWKFFLAISVLEKRSDVLLMLKGEELRRELEELVQFNETPVDSFVGSPGDSGDHMVAEWLSMSKSLIDCTPSSVIELLRSADDRAVANAIKQRQIQMEKELQAQADAHEAALKKERDERDAEEKKAEIKARLTAYYRTHNPEKLDTIDQILKLFDGRIDVLNQKLKKKYGSGFLPDEAPINQVSNQTKNFFMSVNQSINDTKKHVAASVKERRKKNARDDTNLKSHVSVALEVSPTEVIPHICSKKQAAGDRNVLPNADASLSFYLIDCRPESIAREQGRFPKAIIMSPEKLQDPEELQRLIDMFESLRGAVHICVMGEGFASFPVLYNHPLSKEEQKLLEDDISRTSSCALFFLKKGFPFVSLLRGGFAAAHAFLSRSGPPGLSPTEALVDYDPESSLFAQLEATRQEQERFKSASNREKTARAVQRIIDNSMTRLTLAEMRINSSAAGLSNPENVVKVKQSVSGLTKQMPSVSFGRTPPLFMSKKLTTATATGKGLDKQKSITPDDDKKVNSTSTEKMKFRLPSLNSDTSSQRDISEVNVDSSAATLVSTDQGDNQETVDKDASESQPSSSSKETETGGERKLPKIQLELAKNSLSSFANRMKAAESKGMPTEATPTSPKEEGPSKISASLSSFAAKMKTSAATATIATENTATAADEQEKTTTNKSTVVSTAEEGPSKISASLSSFAAKMKTSAATATTATATGSTAANKQEKATTDKSAAVTTKHEGSSKISASLSSFAAKIKTSAATNVTGSTDVDGPEKSTTDKSAADPSKEEVPSKISSSLSSFAAKMKTSAAAAATTATATSGSSAVDESGKTNTSSLTTSFSSFASKMKSSANNVSDTENSPEKKTSNPFSSFLTAKKAEKIASEEEKLGPLTELAKADGNATTDEDESLVFDVAEDEICFD